MLLTPAKISPAVGNKFLNVVPVPVAPSGLVASFFDHQQINLSWTDNSGDEDGFKIYRSLDGISFDLIASVGANVTNYQAVGLLPETEYYFGIKAFNAGGNSAFSNIDSDTTDAAPVGNIAFTSGFSSGFN